MKFAMELSTQLFAYGAVIWLYSAATILFLSAAHGYELGGPKWIRRIPIPKKFTRNHSIPSLGAESSWNRAVQTFDKDRIHVRFWGWLASLPMSLAGWLTFMATLIMSAVAQLASLTANRSESTFEWVFFLLAVSVAPFGTLWVLGRHRSLRFPEAWQILELGSTIVRKAQTREQQGRTFAPRELKQLLDPLTRELILLARRAEKKPGGELSSLPDAVFKILRLRSLMEEPNKGPVTKDDIYSWLEEVVEGVLLNPTKLRTPGQLKVARLVDGNPNSNKWRTSVDPMNWLFIIPAIGTAALVLILAKVEPSAAVSGIGLLVENAYAPVALLGAILTIVSLIVTLRESRSRR